MCTNLNRYAVRLLALLAMLAVSLATQAGRAGYGQDFVRLDAAAVSVEEAQDKAEPAPGAVDPGAYQQRLLALELQQGPYADALAEPLAAMGRHYRQRGEYDEAVKLYTRALHVVRVNDGLYSERQAPLVRDLLGIYRQAQDWEALDERYQYFFRLFGNGQPPLTGLRLRAAVEYIRWQREAISRGLGNEQRRIVDLVELNDALLAAERKGEAAGYHWRRVLTFSQMRNLYLLQQEFEISQTQMVQRGPGYYPGAPPAISEDLDTQRLDNLLRNAPGKGRQLLAQLLPEARLRGARESASVQLALADWYFWNRQQGRAAAAYQQVIATLTEAGEPALLQQWLGEPQELPAEHLYGDVPGVPEPIVVSARYDVSARGRPTNLEVALLSGGNEQHLGTFRRQLSATLFRPRWADGEAEGVSGLARDYRLLD